LDFGNAVVQQYQEQLFQIRQRFLRDSYQYLRFKTLIEATPQHSHGAVEVATAAQRVVAFAQGVQANAYLIHQSHQLTRQAWREQMAIGVEAATDAMLRIGLA